MNRRRRLALALLAVLAVTTLVVGTAAQRTPGATTADECAVDAYAVTATDLNASEYGGDLVRYETLPPAQRALVDRAIANEGEEIRLRDDDERTAARALGGDGARVLYDGTVYLDGTGARCSWVAGVPLWLDPLLFPFVLLYYLFSGPLLWLVVLAVAGGVAYAVGEWARY